MESLPHPVVVHLLSFFKFLASFLRDRICEVDALSDKHYWMVKSSIDYPPLKMFLSHSIYLKNYILWPYSVRETVHTFRQPHSIPLCRIKAASSKGRVLQVVFLTIGLIQS